MDSLLRCPKCCNLFQQPKSLDCGHVVCLKCLSELFHPDVSPYIDCPICDKQTLVLSSANDLPSLAAVEELLKYYTDNDICGGMEVPLCSPRYERLITSPLPYTGQKQSISPRSATNTPSPSSLQPTTTTTNAARSPKYLLNQKQMIPKLSISSSPPQNSAKPNGPVAMGSINVNGNSAVSTTPVKQPTFGVQQGKVEIDEKSLMCAAHSSEKLKFYCTNKECQKLICTECIIDHNGHQFAKIPREADKKVQDIEILLTNMQQYPLRLLKQKQVIEKHMVDGSNMHRETKERISNDIDSMINHLKERRDYLERQIDKDWNEQKLHLNNLVQKMTSNIDLIKDTNQYTCNLLAERAVMEKELIQMFNSTGARDDDSISNNSGSTITSSSGIELTPQMNYVYQDLKYNKMSTTLLKKHCELKKLEDESNQMFNELITNIEWKWDPEFQFPQIYQSNQKRHSPNPPLRTISVSAESMMMGGRRRTISHSPPQSSVNSTPIMNQSSPPPSSSPPIIQRTMTSSVSYNGSNGSGFIPSGLVKIPSNSSVSSISSSASSMQLNKHGIPPLSLPQSISQPNIAALSQSAGSVPASFSPPKTVNMAPISIANNGNGNGANGNGTLKRNPVFGKLLTRKDSVINNRLDYLYSIGGEHSDGTVEMYDIQSDKWKYLAQMPKPLSEFAAIYDNSNAIYCFGGKECPDMVCRYEISKNMWEILDIKLPTARYGHCAVYDGRRYVYLMGGCGVTKTMDRFDVLTKKFVALKPMNHGRTYFNAFYNGTKLIYAVDGYASKDKHSSIEQYDIEKDQWTTVTVIRTPRYLASVTYDARYITIEGGVDRCSSRDFKNSERFDTQTSNWEMVAPEEQIGKSKSKIQFYNSSLFDGGNLVYYLGVNIDDAAPLLYRYNTRTKKLEQLAAMQHMRLTNQLIMVTK